MKRAFTLIEVLIGIFALALALLGLAAIFASTTREVAQNREEVFGWSARRSGEAAQPHVPIQLQAGWNIQRLPSTYADIDVYAATYVAEKPPAIRVTVAMRSGGELRVVASDAYVPSNNDVVISWYGFRSVVRDGVLNNQQFERLHPYLVLPYETTQVLSVHRMPL